jgi:putative transposase
MSEKRRHFPHAIGSSNWHFQWCTKYRYKVFVSDYVKSMCVLALREAGKRYGIDISEVEVQPEHIHMIAAIPLSMSPSKTLNLLKGFSSRLLFKMFPKLRLRYPKGHIWSPGKFAISVGYITLEKAKEYVKKQKAHHADTDFIGRNPCCERSEQFAEGEPFRAGRMSILKIRKTKKPENS